MESKPLESKINHKNGINTLKSKFIFIRNIVARYEQLIRSVNLTLYICFYQFDLNSGTRLVEKLSFEILCFFNFFKIKLRLRYNDKTWSATQRVPLYGC